MGANQLDKAVSDGALGNALAIGLDVAEVTDVAGLIGGSTVGLAEGVDYKDSWVSRWVRGLTSTLFRKAFRGMQGGLTVRAGRSAAVGVVTEGVDVEAALGVGVVAGDVVGDGSGSGLGLLLEDNGSGDLSVTTEDSNCSQAG